MLGTAQVAKTCSAYFLRDTPVPLFLFDVFVVVTKNRIRVEPHVLGLTKRGAFLSSVFFSSLRYFYNHASCEFIKWCREPQPDQSLYATYNNLIYFYLITFILNATGLFFM